MAISMQMAQQESNHDSYTEQVSNIDNRRAAACPGYGGGMVVGASRLSPNLSATAAQGNEERPVLYWYDPMSPQHHFDKPGKSPFMDMDLVPKYASDDAADNDDSGAVKIDARITQNIGMREAVVERIALVSVIEASGLLAFNERDVTLEQVRSAGLVERVWPLAPGDVIAAGQPLVEVLVPEWSAAQAEFLVLRAGADSTLVDAARARLRLLGMSAEVISELEKTGRARQSFIVKSSRAGVLESLDVRSGMTLMPGQMLARIQGIGSVWLEVAVPEASRLRSAGRRLCPGATGRLPGTNLRGPHYRRVACPGRSQSHPARTHRTAQSAR